jgi:hypothetical protein
LGCGGGSGFATVSGTIGEASFNDAVTVMHGDSFIVLFDRDIDCLDVAWVAKTYTDGQAPTEDAFVGLQFTFDNAPQVGTQSVAGDSAVSAWGLDNRDAFALDRGREGIITLDEVSEKKIVGTFEVAFANSGVSGSFESAYCRNLR